MHCSLVGSVAARHSATDPVGSPGQRINETGRYFVSTCSYVLARPFATGPHSVFVAPGLQISCLSPRSGTSFYCWGTGSHQHRGFTAREVHRNRVYRTGGAQQQGPANIPDHQIQGLEEISSAHFFGIRSTWKLFLESFCVSVKLAKLLTMARVVVKNTRSAIDPAESHWSLVMIPAGSM